MRENQSMRDMLKRNVHSIPIGVRYCAFYKKYVLEDAEMLEKSRLSVIRSKEDFHRFIKPVLKSAPVRGHSKGTKERLQRDLVGVLFEYHKALFGDGGDGGDGGCCWSPQMTEHGLGLVARKRFKWDAVCEKRLFGLVCKVDKADFEELKSNCYPSLFQSRDSGDGILFGPASLINHACDGEFRWSNPSKRGVPEAFEGFYALRLKKRKSDAEIVFEEGQELCIVYGMRRKNFVCSCRKCSH